MNEIRVGIADDHSLFREGLRMILSSMHGITLCLEADSGVSLLEQLEQISLDIVLLDIEMKDMGGVEALRRIQKISACPRVIVLSMHTEPRMISLMIEEGACGYLKKDVTKEDLQRAIYAVYESSFYFNESVSHSLLLRLRSKNKKSAPGVELSLREKEVLLLIFQEFTTAEIAEKLFISERTVEGHRKNLCVKLDVKNVAGLVKKAIQLNLVNDAG